jgi:hypothetical protein
MAGLWLWAACAGPTEAPADSAAPTGSSDPGDTEPPERETIVYEDAGAACIEQVDGAARVLVDFGDCLFCSTNVQLWCEAALAEGGRIEVHAGGSVVVEDDCGTYGTCEPTTVWCDGPALAPGSYTLAYGEVTVPFEAPLAAVDWVCTGPANTR